MKTLRITTFASIDGEIDLSVDGKRLCMPFPNKDIPVNNVIDRVAQAYERGFLDGCECISEQMIDFVSGENIRIQDRGHILGKTESLTI